MIRYFPLPVAVAVLTLSLSLASHSKAAVVAVDQATFTPSATAGSPPGLEDGVEYDFASLTFGSNTYSTLSGATSVTGSVSGNAFSNYGYLSGTTSPGSATAAATGLSVNFASNPGVGGAVFQMGSALDDFTHFAFVELTVLTTNPDAITLELVDNTGASIGTGYTLDIATADYGADLAIDADGPTAGWQLSASNLTQQATLRGVAFTMSDFTGSGGDLSTATGFQLNNSTTVDPVAMIAVVPEPSTGWLLLTGTAALALIKRQRRRAA